MPRLYVDTGYSDLARPTSGHSVIWSETLRALAQEQTRWQVLALVRGSRFKARRIRADFDVETRATLPTLLSRIERWDWYVPRIWRRTGQVVLQHGHEPGVRALAPRVSYFYDLAFEDDRYRATFSPVLLKELGRWTRVAANTSDHLLALSSFTADTLSEYYEVPRSKISVVYPGVNHHQLAEATKSATKVGDEFGLPTPYLLHVSVLQPRKNIIPLVDAWRHAQRELPRHNLVLVGGRGWLDEPILERINTVPRTIYFGEAGREITWRLMAQADCLAALGSFEGFGIPALEALAVGTPVVRAKSGALPEIWDDGRLLVDPHDVLEVASALREAVELKRDQTYTAAAKERARSFTWQRTARGVLRAAQLVLE